MKLAVVGSRGFDDYSRLKAVLDEFNDVEEIISGGARGTDSLARRYAEELKIRLREFLPDWQQYGRAAGMIRNRDIISNCDYCIAFWDGKSPGTKGDIEICKRLNKEYKIIYV